MSDFSYHACKNWRIAGQMKIILLGNSYETLIKIVEVTGATNSCSLVGRMQHVKLIWLW